MLLPSVKPSISASVRPSVNRAMDAIAAAAWTPDQLTNVLQRMDFFAYAASNIEGLPVVESSVGTAAVPRGQRCYLADGVDDFIAVASLTGSETVVSKQGTSTVTIAAGRINLTAGTVWEIVLSNGSTYYCNEESGTTAYDSSGNGRHGTITNATLATFHSTSTSVLRNYANDRGYTLSGAVVIPRNEAVPTQDAAGGSLQFSGPIKLNATMEVPCITGDGSSVLVDFGTPLIPATGNFALSFWTTTPTGLRFLFSQDDSSTSGSVSIFHNAGSINVFVRGVGGVLSVAVPAKTWYQVAFSRVGNLFTLTVDGASATWTNAQTFFTGVNSWLLNMAGSGAADSRIADFRFTNSSGVTRFYPLQAGPGTSNTNRDIHWVASDGTGGVVSGAIVNGTVASIWANRTNVVRDWCLEYGGSIAANGAFVPGRIGSSLDAAGNAKGIAAGTHGNPHSRFVPNFWSAPSLVNIGSTASDLYAPSGMAGVQAESTADTRYANQTRYLAVATALTGSDKTNAQGWVA